MSYRTRSKSKQIAEKLAALTNIDPGLSDESCGESDTDEFPPGNQSSGATRCLHVCVERFFFIFTIHHLQRRAKIQIIQM